LTQFCHCNTPEKREREKRDIALQQGVCHLHKSPEIRGFLGGLRFRKNARAFKKVRFGWNRSSFGTADGDFRSTCLRLALERGFIDMRPRQKSLEGKGDPARCTAMPAAEPER
jgi:hypothetical protein